MSTDEERDEVKCSLGPGLPAVVCCCDEEEHRKYRGCCDRGVILIERKSIIITSGKDRRGSHDEDLRHGEQDRRILKSRTKVMK